MSEEKNLSDFEKTQLRANQQGKSIIEIAIEDIEKEQSLNLFNSKSEKNNTINLDNLVAIRKAMDEINIKERSEIFQQYYDELVHSIVELKRKNHY